MIDTGLLKKVASTGKPIIMSTGMATLGEIEESVKTLRENGANHIALLKCTSSYPAPPEEMNLKTIPHLAEAFDVVAGLSDHTLGISVPIAAVALGARIIEKHFTLSRDLPGPDTAFSLEPKEFKEMVDSVRTIEKALGQVSYGQNEKEAKSRIFRRSLFVVEDIEEGEDLNDKNVRSIRPGNGLPPKYLDEIIGQKAAVAIKRGTPLSWNLIK
jgi:sialic acid synthase SpsE